MLPWYYQYQIPRRTWYMNPIVLRVTVPVRPYTSDGSILCLSLITISVLMGIPIPLQHVISANIEDRSYRTLTPCGDGPIALRRCLGCVLAPIRALSRFHDIYTSNRTRKVTNWCMFVEISTNTADRRVHSLRPPRWSPRSACSRPVHSLDCPGHPSDGRRAQQSYKRRTVAQRARTNRRTSYWPSKAVRDPVDRV